MSETCKRSCGHDDECVCVSAKQDAPLWLDKPDGDGWWWRLYGPDSDGHTQTQVIEIRGTGAYIPHANTRYQRVQLHTPPPAPLPREQMVTLTAKVSKTGEGRGLAEVFISSGDRTLRWSSMPWTMDDSVKWVRDNYNIEPAVEGES